MVYGLAPYENPDNCDLSIKLQLIKARLKIIYGASGKGSFSV